MQSYEVTTKVHFIKKVLMANLGFAMFGTPILVLFYNAYTHTGLTDALGVVTVFFTVFMIMHLGLDIIYKHVFRCSRHS